MTIRSNNGIRLSSLVEESQGLIRFDANKSDLIFLSVEYDSRKIKEGSLFVAIEGFETDGHKYIEDAVKNGALAVILSVKRISDFIHLADKGVILLISPNTRKALSLASSVFYGSPSRDMALIGITGTNGKTSITYMMESILHECGIPAGVIGTINYRWGGKIFPAPNTTPESRDINEMLAMMKSEGVRAVIMEVSSHALELNRVDDLNFDAAVFTNLTRDHLDFHADFEDYFRAKRILFQLLDKSSKANKAGIVNTDDEYGKRIYAGRNDYSFPMITYGTGKGADFMPGEGSISNLITGLRYELESPVDGTVIELHLTGRFHLYNSMAAIAAARALNIPFDKITAGLKNLMQVPGRFDVINSGLGFFAVIDYAHTGDALLKLLQSVNELKHNRVITVFGCGGDRDRTKRPLMGRIAEDNSDYVIVTSDNPRTEDRDSIIKEIVSGMNGKNMEIIPDREEAIKRGVSIAEKGDIIVIAGKGHEDYQIIGKKKIHFDDHELASMYLQRRMA